MNVKIKLVVCVLIIFLFIIPGISGELSPSDYQKLDPALSLMLDNPAIKHLVYTQMTGKEFTENTTQINVLIKTNLDRSALKKLGIQIHARIGDIVTATVPIDLIPKLVTPPQISYIQGSRVVSIHNDISVSEIGAKQVRQQFNLTGKGVIIGIVDTGIDWRHQDFRKSDGTTRIIALLDFSDPGDVDEDGDLDGPDQFGGTLYTKQEINNALNGIGTVNEKDIVGHGTHVAGSAAGNGRATGNEIPAGTYVGVAPEVDLIIVKGTRESGSINFESTDYVNAIAFIDSIAEALNQPYVINLSLGGSLGPHDGKDLSEQAIDNLLSGSDSKGKAIVVSAGNEGDKNIHASGIFGNGVSEIETKFSIPSYTPETNNINDYVLFEGWYKGIFIYISNAKGGPSNLNGDKQISIQIYDFDAEKPPTQGEWKIIMIGSVGRFDFWLSGSSMDVSITSNIDPSMILGTPGTAFNAITVGSYITKTNWIDLDRNSVYVPGLTLGEASGFSSPGPTRDGRTKPEISAPGEKIAASYSVDAPPDGEHSIFKSNNDQLPNGYICRDGKHAVSQGTSFAAPHVSGVIALMLQKNPQLDANKIREALIATARFDEYTQTVPNNKWGYGKIDAFASVQYIIGESPEKKFTVSIFQNPAITQYIDFYLISKYSLQSIPTATIKISGITSNTITMTEIEPKIYKGEYQFSMDGTAALKINAAIQGESPTTLTEYFGVKLLKANSGGTIVFDKVKLSIPRNGLLHDTYFTIIPEKVNDLENELQAISKAYQLGPSNSTFNQPATLTFNYDDETVVDLDELKLDIYVYENGEWERLRSSVDVYRNSVSVTIDQLGTFRMFYDPCVEIVDNLPNTFKLNQNYPNPFNASTVIEFQVPYDIQLSVKIFNLKGELVKTLFEGAQQAGYHKIKWDGKNINNQPASAGLYICRLTSENYSMSRKMLLLK